MKENEFIYVMINGDEKGRFTEIYNKELDSLFRYCVLRVSDREKAIEITQEVFTRLWNSMVSGKEIENPRAMLFAMARNLIIDWYRRIKTVSLESLSSKDDDIPFDVSDGRTFQEIEISADAKRVLKIVSDLLPQYREIIMLRYVENLTPKEIADILGLSSNIVSVRLTRGMEALRKLMGININNHE